MRQIDELTSALSIAYWYHGQHSAAALCAVMQRYIHKYETGLLKLHMLLGSTFSANTEQTNLSDLHIACVLNFVL